MKACKQGVLEAEYMLITVNEYYFVITDCHYFTIIYYSYVFRLTVPVAAIISR